MSDNIEGPSIAAHRAHATEENKPLRKIRIFFKTVLSFLKRKLFTGSGGKVPLESKSSLTSLGVSNLRLKCVEDVAIPRAEIISVPVTIGLDELVKVRESGLTRLPVFNEKLDTPVGLLHLKDLSLKYGFKEKFEKFNLKKMVRPVLFVPPSMSIGVLMSKMQAERKHMALVIDEYGGVDGLVTIEDLIEQVVGEIEDEHDIDEVDLWKLEKPGCYIVQGKAPLEEFEAELGLRLSDDEMDEEIDTLGGLIFMLLGRVPARNEIVRHPSGAEFVIIDADPRRVKSLRVLSPKSKL